MIRNSFACACHQQGLHLAHRVARQIGAMKTRFGTLKLADFAPGGNNGVAIQHGPGWTHDSDDALAKSGCGPTTADSADAGHLVERNPRFRPGGDVVTAADDQDPAAADDGDVAPRVDLADVTGLEPAIRSESSLFFRRAPVAAKRWGPHLNAADLVHRAGIALCRPGNAHADARVEIPRCRPAARRRPRDRFDVSMQVSLMP